MEVYAHILRAPIFIMNFGLKNKLNGYLIKLTSKIISTHNEGGA
jgi:hypothetical protein